MSVIVIFLRFLAIVFLWNNSLLLVMIFDQVYLLLWFSQINCNLFYKDFERSSANSVMLYYSIYLLMHKQSSGQSMTRSSDIVLPCLHALKYEIFAINKCCLLKHIKCRNSFGNTWMITECSNHLCKKF